MIHFSEKSRDLNFVNLFFKCGNYHKSRFYKQILKLLEISFSFSYAELTLKTIQNFKKKFEIKYTDRGMVKNPSK
ncbi:hypothetical protein LEP1GSC086_0072 [Leptospira weilii str. LNT 1234]|nr:hypothetical protein LEP1GSC086_0072 [Leptospira weilii str. LNT 1234]